MQPSVREPREPVLYIQIKKCGYFCSCKMKVQGKFVFEERAKLDFAHQYQNSCGCSLDQTLP